MSYQIYFRLLGYVSTIAMHISNLIYMRHTILSANISEKSLDNVGIGTFKKMEYRYFTTWTVGLQIGYAALGTLCDLLVLLNKHKKNYRLPKYLGSSREIMFAGLVWPSTWVVFTVFWTLFNYDRSLIFPAYLDKIVTRLSNHVIHTMIVPVVVWEVMFRPRKPKSHYRNIAQLAIHMLAYVFVLHFTYHEHGVWLYPIFKAVQGTIHFYLLHFYVAVMCLMFYRLQWRLNSLIHVVEDVKKIH